VAFVAPERLRVLNLVRSADPEGRIRGIADPDASTADETLSSRQQRESIAAVEESIMADIAVSCPHCSARCRVSGTVPGQTWRCPVCTKPFTLNSTSAPPGGGPPGQPPLGGVESLVAPKPDVPDQNLVSGGSNAGSIADELRKLQELRTVGVLPDEEFAKARAAILASLTRSAAAPVRAGSSDLENEAADFLLAQSGQGRPAEPRWPVAEQPVGELGGKEAKPQPEQEDQGHRDLDDTRHSVEARSEPSDSTGAGFWERPSVSRAEQQPQKSEPGTGRGKTVWNSPWFHIPSEGEPTYDPLHIAIHKLVVAVGLAFGALGLLPALAIAVFLAVLLWKEPFLAVCSFVADIAIIPTIVAAFYLFGAALPLMFTPNAFLRGPIGRKWAKAAGVRSPLAIRCVCLCLWGVVVAVVVFVVAFFRG